MDVHEADGAEQPEVVDARLGELAALLAGAVHAIRSATLEGLFPNDGTEAAAAEALTKSDSWPDEPWPEGAAMLIHQIGLLLMQSMAGHLADMHVLVDRRAVFWSLPSVARGAVESSARLFAIYARPYLACGVEHLTVPVARLVYASAYYEIFDAGVDDLLVAKAWHDAQPSDETAEEIERVKRELTRNVEVFGSLFGGIDEELLRSRRTFRDFRLDGYARPDTTTLVESMAAWLWREGRQPVSPYRILSQASHASLSSAMSGTRVRDEHGRRHLDRVEGLQRVEYYVLLPVQLAWATLRRLSAFYGWSAQWANGLVDELVLVFPDKVRVHE